MNKKFICLIAAALALLSASGQKVTFTGVGDYPVIPIAGDKNSTGLDTIYVVYDTQGVEMTYTSEVGKRAVWKDFNFMEIPGVQWDGRSTKHTMTSNDGDKGYIFEVDGETPFCCWVVNYAAHRMSLNSISCESISPCDLLKISVDGTAPKILYTTAPGSGKVSKVLDRQLELSYNTLVWNDSTSTPPEWQEQPVIKTFESLDDGIQLNASEMPLCDTEFTLSRDRFLKEWGIEAPADKSDWFETKAVRCRSTYEQEDRQTETDTDNDTDNENGTEEDTDNENETEEDTSDGLGGSAPVHIVFTGYPTDAVSWSEWEIATDPEFEQVIYQYNQDVMDYTFNDTGTFYVRYNVANADGTCEDSGETYKVDISESNFPKNYELPNILYLGLDFEDKWTVPKAKIKSIVEFHCWIFNRWGNLVYEFTDPYGGWDGKYNGQYVDTGVYYCVIKARGSDGQPYSRRATITVVRDKGSDGISSDETGDVLE